MTSSSWDRSRRIAAASSVLAVITVAAGVLVLALSVGVPEAWWPHTGQAFAADSHAGHRDPCAPIVGRAKAYCERCAAASASSGHHHAGAAWRLVPAGAGVAALVVWRRRRAAGRRRG
ncbi:hypothetical protein A6P39_041995 (plasmid) [Streptomyces sp. FXJ1.172]|uniref:hypothetical protein n=1 Tax=Streptomyces sp. FXJ1.172 TaxID=710705 RepID=UPI0023DD3B2F|nr:hypothetical protein [Streptomyces sp. FXJ1.172]WEP00751.1 hypothetical protein A6P39_041995 [Streptomyces sp. FXJ1.172]